jgi:hypothetical protein
MFVAAIVFGGVTAVFALRRWIHRDQMALAGPWLARALSLLLLAAVVSAALLAWRHWYFGAWLPQPVSAKSRGLSKSALFDGWRYVTGQAWLRIDGGLWVIATLASGYVAGCLLGRSLPDLTAAIAALFTGVGLLFVVVSGGDWMEGGRFLVPLLPTAVICVLAALRAWTPRHVGMVAVILVATQLTGTLLFARTESSGGPPWALAHVRDGEGQRGGWFEIAHRMHYRDLVCGSRLVDVITRVRARTGRPVSVMSGQMGLMAYQAALSKPGDVRFFDRAGLVTRDFTRCPVTSYSAHTPGGLFLTYEFLFAQSDRIRQICGIDLPDVIYDVTTDDWQRARVVEINGYRVVYRQDGSLLNGSRWFPGAPVRGVEFVAVRRELSDGLDYPAVHFQ